MRVRRSRAVSITFAVAGIAALAMALLACGGASPQAASTGTRGAVERADDAERARQHDRARALYQAAVRDAADAPSRAYAARAYADALLLWGEGAAAAAALQIVVEAAPADPSAWHDLGIVLHTLGDVAGAQRALERAAALAPADPRPHLALAALLWKRGERTEAIAAYRLLLTLELPERVRDKVRWALEQLATP